MSVIPITLNENDFFEIKCPKCDVGIISRRNAQRNTDNIKKLDAKEKIFFCDNCGNNINYTEFLSMLGVSVKNKGENDLDNSIFDNPYKPVDVNNMYEKNRGNKVKKEIKEALERLGNKVDSSAVVNIEEAYSPKLLAKLKSEINPNQLCDIFDKIDKDIANIDKDVNKKYSNLGQICKSYKNKSAFQMPLYAYELLLDLYGEIVFISDLLSNIKNPPLFRGDKSEEKQDDYVSNDIKNYLASNSSSIEGFKDFNESAKKLFDVLENTMDLFEKKKAKSSKVVDAVDALIEELDFQRELLRKVTNSFPIGALTKAGVK